MCIMTLALDSGKDQCLRTYISLTGVWQITFLFHKLSGATGSVGVTVDIMVTLCCGLRYCVLIAYGHGNMLGTETVYKNGCRFRVQKVKPMWKCQRPVFSQFSHGMNGAGQNARLTALKQRFTNQWATSWWVTTYLRIAKSVQWLAAITLFWFNVFSKAEETFPSLQPLSL